MGDPGVWAELDALIDRGTRSVVRGRGALFLLERMPDYLVTQKARVVRTFQNIRLFQDDRVGEPPGRPAQSADARLRLHRARRDRRSRLRAGGTHGDRAGALLARQDRSTGRADDPAGELPTARNADSKSPAPCAPSRCCSASTSPAPGSIHARKPSWPITCSPSATSISSVLLIEHDMSLVMQISDHIVVLDHGYKIADGTPAEVRRSERSPPISASSTTS